MLAGHTWEVLEVNQDKRIIFVKRVKGAAPVLWSGSGGMLHDRILQRIRLILQEDKDYGYLQPRAQQRLTEARQLARRSNLTERSILDLGGDRFMIVPWRGTRIVRTLAMMLEHTGTKVLNDNTPFYFEISKPLSTPNDVQHDFKALASAVPAAQEIARDLAKEGLIQNKYDRLVPEPLLREAIAVDVLDVEGAKSTLQKI